LTTYYSLGFHQEPENLNNETNVPLFAFAPTNHKSRCDPGPQDEQD